ncbi:MAG: hypothetical protein M3Z41_03820 [Candidatus Eremiobacteraeota bacterium]|nr:hypothetical protein [Candidatus Eremiobacteraeota bacterium]
MTARLAQRSMTEAFGTAFLLIAIVGSGVMAQRLAGADLLVAPSVAQFFRVSRNGCTGAFPIRRPWKVPASKN